MTLSLRLPSIINVPLGAHYLVLDFWGLKDAALVVACGEDDTAETDPTWPIFLGIPFGQTKIVDAHFRCAP